MENNKWNFLIIKDPHFLTGKSVLSLFETVTQIVNFEYIVINDINGSGKDWLISSLQDKENSIMPISDFLKTLPDINQFDWGDFFLFREYPEKWNNPHDYNYSTLVEQSDTTIRAVDNQYFYIYTPYQEIKEVLGQKLLIESEKIDLLEKLDYPY